MVQSFQPGATFAGVYEIVKPLSAGGMGEVFVVRHRDLGELRAMKLMHPQVGRDARLSAKFTQEARIGTRIKSEHVVRVLDVGVDAASQRPWFAMELLEGSDMRSFVDKGGPHSPEVIRKILGQLGHALSAAHAAGIVHRDLKPENIFIASSARLDEAFTVKVLDFGIAKVVAESSTDMSMAIGSPLWMAPEQAQAGAPIGPHTDVWAVGLIAFYLLTGKIFWLAAHIPSATAIQVLQETMMQPIPPASERAAALGCRFAVPAGFDAWFAQCMARQGSERFSDATVAFDRLSAILGGRASLVSQPIYMPVGVAAAPAVTPLRLDQPVPQQTILQTHARGNTTEVAGSQSLPQAAPKPPSRATGLVFALIVAAAALGVGAFVFKDSLLGGSEKHDRKENDPVAIVQPTESAPASSGGSAPTITTSTAGITASSSAPSVSETASASTATAAPTTKPAPTPTTGPIVNPPIAPTTPPPPQQDCKEKTYIGPDGKRVRKPWCPA